MTKTLETVSQKIKSLQDIDRILEEDRQKGLKIVQCHGVFDLLHLGHIRHFKTAKAQGDKLVISVTPDRFVNKGPGRPVFSEALRLEAIAALEDVDYVVLNDSPDAVSIIKKLKPSLYVKGMEYANHAADVTGKIAEEMHAIESVGGKIFYTDDLVFSSSSLLNQHFEEMPQEVLDFLGQLKKQFSIEEILQKIESLKNLKVLVIGDAILDEYQFVSPLGQSGKGLHMVARLQEKEVFLGGSLIIANHLAQFTPHVTLLTALGKDCPYLSFISHHLDPTIQRQIAYLEDSATLIKKRYVMKDGKVLTKLFETYSGQEESLHSDQTNQIVKYLKEQGPSYDLILVCDFGNGFTNPEITEAISNTPSFIALNTQINSGNRGFNVVTHYNRANYISLNEPELRLALHDKTSSLEKLAQDISESMHAENISVTQGVKGVFCHAAHGEKLQVPAFATTSVDRIGAGDCFLSLSSLCLAKKFPHILAGFIGSIAAAISVQMIGNQEAIKKASLCKFITRLLK